MQLHRGQTARASASEAWPRREAAAGAPSAEVRRRVRTAGTMLAVASLLLAVTAGAQGAVYGPAAEGSGALAWVFALFVGASVIGVFLLVLYLVRPPVVRRPGDPPPGSARQRG